jgi:lysophospholipase L1-like esterase
MNAKTGEIRICFIGDSYVAGVGDTAFIGWTGRVARGMAVRGRKVTASSLGVRRETSRDILTRWHAEVQCRLAPVPTNVEKRVVGGGV